MVRLARRGRKIKWNTFLGRQRRALEWRSRAYREKTGRPPPLPSAPSPPGSNPVRSFSTSRHGFFLLETRMNNATIAGAWATATRSFVFAGPSLLTAKLLADSLHEADYFFSSCDPFISGSLFLRLSLTVRKRYALWPNSPPYLGAILSDVRGEGPFARRIINNYRACLGRSQLHLRTTKADAMFRKLIELYFIFSKLRIIEWEVLVK